MFIIYTCYKVETFNIGGVSMKSLVIVVIKDNVPKIVKPDRKTRNAIINIYNEQKLAEKNAYGNA